jgi:putative transposase
MRSPEQSSILPAVWTSWLPPHHGAAARQRLACWPGPCRADMASRGLEGASAAEAAWTAVVQRWLVRSPTTRTLQPCMELRFVSAETYDGRTVRLLNLIDEHSRECLLVRTERRWSSAKVIEAVADVMVVKGVPQHLRSDNGPELVARDLRKCLANTGTKTAYIEPGSPWENGFCESFNSKLGDEFLNGEIFYSMKEIRVPAERWRVHFNTIRPHSSLGYRPPAPEAWTPTSLGCGETGIATLIPPPRAPHGNYLNPEIAALHQQIIWFKRSGRPSQRVEFPVSGRTPTRARPDVCDAGTDSPARS